MKEFVISTTEAGQRFDKYLARRLPKAAKGFLYKMLRKKNITLNGKKADGREITAAGDTVRIFFSDETYAAFAAPFGVRSDTDSLLLNTMPAVLFENEHLLIVDKPAGLLSQKARKEDISLVEYINAYLVQQGALTGTVFRAGICNRLDRNTSGIVVAGKTILGARQMTAAFRERRMEKYYLCLVSGRLTQRARLNGYLCKDHEKNTVKVFPEGTKALPEGAQPIETEYIPVCSNARMTLLKVHLITGRSHQIRAHLSAVGHALIGDEKYGAHKVNAYFRQQYQIGSQLLHAYELKLMPDPQIGLSKGLTIHAAPPDAFWTVLKGEQLWEPGIPEVLEALH